MSSGLYQKDTASRLRAQLRRKAISLYYNAKGPRMTFEEVAKKMQLPQKYIEKWINRYEKTGLHGYVGQRQSAILCIYKKNPNITLSQLRLLLKKVGIVLSNSELNHILKNLKHILTDPMFKSASEEQILRKLAKVTKVQAKSVIRMNQKMKLERAKEGGIEHAYAQPAKSIFLDHNYVAHPELCYDEDDYSLYDNIDKLAKYKTDLMNKIATVSQNLDELFENSVAVPELDNKDLKRYKISLLREQMLYLCLEMKGPRLSVAEVVQNLPLVESMVNKWIEQAKSIKRFVHAKHVNKCCGKIQESIVRLVKLNSELTMEEVKSILRHVNIDLSNLKLERQLNSVKYMINGPDVFVDREYEELAMNENEIDYCIKVLSLKIGSVNMNKQKRQKINNIEKPPVIKQLSLQNIIESYMPEHNRRSDDVTTPSVIVDYIEQHPLPRILENKIDIARHNLHEELANIHINNEKQKQIYTNLQRTQLLNNENNSVIKRASNNKMNGLNLLQAVTFDEMAKLGLIKERNRGISLTKVEQNQIAESKLKNRIGTAEFNEDVSLLQYMSMASSHKNRNCLNKKQNEQSEQYDVIEENVYNIDLGEHDISYEDAVKENTSPNCLIQKDNSLNSKHEQLADYSQIDINSYNTVIEESVVHVTAEECKDNSLGSKDEQLADFSQIDVNSYNTVIEEPVADENEEYEHNSLSKDEQIVDYSQIDINSYNTVIEESVVHVNTEECKDNSLKSKHEQPVDCSQIDINSYNVVIEEPVAHENVEECQNIFEVISDVSPIIESNAITVSFSDQEHQATKQGQCINEKSIPAKQNDLEFSQETNKNWETSISGTNECKVVTNVEENVSEEVEEESGIGSLIFDGKTQDEEDITDITDITDEHMISNLSASSDESSSYKERKRKYSENDDEIFESEESEFEPIDDLSFIGLDSDSDVLVKEETDDSEKDIMTEYIECEDNSVVIKYWIAT